MPKGRSEGDGSHGKTATEERIIAAAVGLFSKKWYGTVSVAEICRAAGLSNGVFYRYFDGKEALFRRILGRVLELIKAKIESIGAAEPGTAASLREFALTIMRIPAEEPELVSVFREGQYRLLEYERQLVSIYTRTLSAALGREVGLPEYLFALGGIRFCAIRRFLYNQPNDLDSVVAILQGGLFRGQSFDAAKVFGGVATPLPVALDEDARARLLRFGKKLFGEKGYFETNIHEITDAAGLSVGAFYVYFSSKEAFYSELIAQVGREVRSFIARNLGTGPAGASLNRLERELRGLWLWLVYLSIDRNCYGIVREAEFVLPAAVRDYYGAFIAGYRKNPEGNAAPGSGIDEQTAIEFLLGIAHYAGIEVAFERSITNARAAVESLGAYLSRGFADFLA
jgi:AcrR family transcriptional regulator